VIHEEIRTDRVRRGVGQLLRAAARDIVRTPVVLRLFSLYFLAMFGVSLVNPFVPVLVQGLYAQGHAGPDVLLPTVIGSTLTSAGVAMALTTPVWGRLGDKIGRWRTLPICLFAVTLALAAEAASPALLPLQVAVVGAGLFQGGIATSILALLATLTPEDRRATVLNFSLLPSQLSWFLAPLCGAWLVTLGLRVPFVAGASVAVLALLLALALARRNPHEDETTAAMSEVHGSASRG
jgi:MFS family permease